jgi:UDP-sugar transporter A1/2/3
LSTSISNCIEQNSLFYVALTNLPAPVFQVLYQMKLLTTALDSVVLLLTRRYSSLQWLSLCSLTFGAVLAVTAHNTSSDDGAKPNALIGIFAIIIACFCSAFAGVGFEKLLKQDSTSGWPSLWVRNIQLGTFFVLFATLQ